MKQRDVTTLVDVVPHPDGGPDGFVLEIANALGESLRVAIVTSEDLSPLHANKILAVRQFASYRNVSFEDVRRVFLPAIRRRVILNFEAQAEGIDTDHVLTEILKHVPEKTDAAKPAQPAAAAAR